MGGFKVLVLVEDNEEKKLIKRALRVNFYGIELSEADNNERACALLEKISVHLVISRAQSSHIDGGSLAQWMQTNEALSKVPFIMLAGPRGSGNAGIEDTQHTLSVMPELSFPTISLITEPLTAELLVQAVLPYSKNNERRQAKRYKAEGNVSIKFEDQIAWGRLVDVSMKGILIFFHKTNVLPRKYEIVTVTIEPDGKPKVFGLEGLVVRVELMEGYMDSKYVKVAIMFKDQDDEKEKDLAACIEAIRGE